MNDDHRILGPSEREAIIESLISSQALAGITVPREMAERLFDEVWNEHAVAALRGLLAARAAPPTNGGTDVP